jgi:hypothetical protein
MRTEDGGIFVGPADGKDLTNPIGGRMVVKIRDEDTAGAYSVHDNTIPAGSPGPRPHLHRRHERRAVAAAGTRGLLTRGLLLGGRNGGLEESLTHDGLPIHSH